MGLVLMKKGKERKRIGMMLVIMAASGTLLLSCSSGGGETPVGGGNPNESSQIVSALKPGNIYHWKVIADDGKGGITESDPRTFTTQ
ncbi:MAG: hypothetical protein ABGX83_03295 [Nitrospira sp.]|nr:hypothetical protein [Candidatus Manganitrophaceae bacterium]